MTSLLHWGIEQLELVAKCHEDDDVTVAGRVREGKMTPRAQVYGARLRGL
jgi:hypothetical protein